MQQKIGSTWGTNRSTKQLKENRLLNIDLLKCLAIMMVVSLHVPLWKYNFISEPTIGRVAQFGIRLLSEGVPLFAAINGFLLLKKNTFDIIQHICRIKHLFLLIVLWSAFLNCLQYLIIGIPEPLSIETMTYYLLQPSFGIWFLQSLLGVYIVSGNLGALS